MYARVVNAMLKRRISISFFKTAGLTTAQMSGGSELHAADPACEKASTLNLICSCGIVYLLLEPITGQYVLLR